MTLEEEVFAERTILPTLLVKAGFQREENTYSFRQQITSEMELRAVYVEYRLSGGVFDISTGEEYIPIRMSRISGKYTASLKEKYLEFLQKTADQCTVRTGQISPRTSGMISMLNEVFRMIPTVRKEKGRIRICFNVPDTDMPFAVFRHPAGDSPDRLYFRMTDGDDCPVDAEYDERESMYYVSVNALSNDELIAVVMRSREISEKIPSLRKKWLIPANPKYYDIDHAFAERDTLFWTQTAKIQKGDLVYIYYGMPYGHIRYECIVIEADLEAEPDPQGLFLFRKLMRIRMIRKFADGRISRSVMKKCGVVSVRSARFMPEALYKEIIRVYGGENERTTEKKK